MPGLARRKPETQREPTGACWPLGFRIALRASGMTKYYLLPYRLRR
jgi:hypothetical protein